MERKTEASKGHQGAGDRKFAGFRLQDSGIIRGDLFEKVRCEPKGFLEEESGKQRHSQCPGSLRGEYLL